MLRKIEEEKNGMTYIRYADGTNDPGLPGPGELQSYDDRKYKLLLIIKESDINEFN